MSKPTIAIVGLGVIGTSMGLALKKAGGNFEIVGHDREPSIAGKARKKEALDKTSWNLINATEEADLVILAIPVSAVEETLKAMGPYLKPGCLIIDTCAVKRPVLQWADEILPDNINFVGGDPIVEVAESNAGQSGSDLANESLFQNKVFCLCPSARTKPESVQVASDLVSAIGAQPYFLDAAEHDGLVAGVEHLPLLLSATLMEIVAGSPSWREMRKLAGDTFGRVGDLPEDSAPALRSTSLTNSDNLIRWIDETVGGLQRVKSMIVDADEDALEDLFERAIDNRIRWLTDRARGFAGEDLPPRTEVPSYWKSMFGMGGGFLRRRGGSEEDEKAGRKKRKR